MRSTLRITLLLALTTTGGMACSTARAAAPVERPALEIPPPPPRVIVPLPPPEAPLPEPVEDLPPNPGAAAPRPRPQQPKADPAKVEPKIEAPPEQQPQPPPAQPPPQQLRTPEGGNAKLANQIRDTLKSAREILDKIDPNGLREPRRKAHADARLFAEQADEALKAANLVFARELADKAERLAKELQGR